MSVVDSPTFQEDSGFFEPQAHDACVLAAARKMDASFIQPLPKLHKVNGFFGGMHVLHALDQRCSVEMHKNVPDQFGM